MLVEGEDQGMSAHLVLQSGRKVPERYQIMSALHRGGQASGNLSIRGLIHAAALSLLVHAIVLWPDAAGERKGVASTPLTARLETPPSPAGAPEPQVAAVSPVPPSRPSPIRPKAVVAAKTGVAEDMLAAQPQMAPPVASPPVSVPSVAATIDVPARSAGGMRTEGADAEGMRQYRVALAREARRYRDYPAAALAAGIGGVAEIRVEVAASGGEQVALARSSGDGRLDEAALGMVGRAAPRTALPETLRGKAFAVNVPLQFDPLD